MQQCLGDDQTLGDGQTLGGRDMHWLQPWDGAGAGRAGG